MGIVAFVAGVAFLGAMVFLTTYTRTNRNVYDTLENWSFLVLFLALAVLILDLHRRYVDQRRSSGCLPWPGWPGP